MNFLKKYKYRIIILVIIFVLPCIFMLKKFNPENVNFYPPCLVYEFTGFKCAGCGMTRAIHNLLNFKFKTAFEYNPLLFLLIIYVIYYIIIFGLYKLKKIIKTEKLVLIPLYILLFLTILFMILRNIF